MVAVGMCMGGAAGRKVARARRAGTAVRAPLRQRWAVWTTAAAASALSVAAALSFGAGGSIRVPTAVVLQPARTLAANPRAATLPAEDSSKASSAPGAAPGGPSVAETVTVVTAAPALVVQAVGTGTQVPPQAGGDGAGDGLNDGSGDGPQPESSQQQSTPSGHDQTGTGDSPTPASTGSPQVTGSSTVSGGSRDG